MKILAIALLFAAGMAAQNTTLTATNLKDLSGNPLTGSACFWTGYPDPKTSNCQNVTNGAFASSVVLANGTYTVTISENLAVIWQLSGAVLSGGTLAADTLFNAQFSFVIGGSNLYLTAPLGLINVLYCNGNAVAAPNLPNTSTVSINTNTWIVNTSTTTACSGTVNQGGTVFLQGAASTTFSIPARNTAQMLFTSANGWVIGHIGT